MSYNFQSFSFKQIFTSSQANQMEVNIRDHIHGRNSVAKTGVSFPVTTKTGGFTATTANIGEMFDCDGTFTVGFQAVATLGNGWCCGVTNTGSGLITVDPNGAETIDGGTTLIIPPDLSVLIWSDGTALFSIGRRDFTLGTEQSTTSGTSKTFGSISAGTKVIVIMFEGVSLTAAVNLDITIGDAGGLETSNYVSTGFSIGTTTINSSPSTSEFIMNLSESAAGIVSGTMKLTLKNSSNFTWISSHVAKIATAGIVWGGGHKSLSAELTQLRISGGTFDAGSINIMYR